jgi:hypothetical protein
MKALSQFYQALVSIACLLALSSGIAQAAPVQTATPITGEIEGLTLTTPGDVWSGGTVTVGGQMIILPRNLLINLPNDFQTLQQLYSNAPAACIATGESGLAKADKCNSRATGAQVTILANRTDSDNVIAGQVDIVKALESVSGTITYIDTSGGYFRVNGDPANAAGTGVMVRVNDPPLGNPALGRHTVQQGAGCAVGNTLNCSPDVRFKVDPDNYTFAYISGYPACIPTSGNDPNCPATNRPAPAPQTLLTNPVPIVAADSRRFAPIQLGDSVKADGSFETVGGVTFLSASSVRVLVDLTTRTTDALGSPDLTQVDYLIINEAGWDGPAYPAGRVRGRYLTNATLRGTEVDYFSVHYDPVNNAPHEQILYSTQFNKQQGAVIFNVPTGVYDSQIRFDFLPAAKILGNEPCIALRQGPVFDSKKFGPGTPVIPGVDVTTYCTSSTAGTPQDVIDNFNLMVPIFREIMAHSTRSYVATGQALDIHGRPTQSGKYKLPNAIAYGAFEDINLGMSAFPVQFSGNPWLLDRRLSPNGCIGPCELTQQPLSPFPFEGIDPRAIAPTFGFVGTVLPTPNRMFAFMNTAGQMTGQLAWPPANPPAFPILATPVLSLFPPFADEDAASTKAGVPVTVSVLANDVAVFGTIDPASVKIASPPASGLTQVNPDGTITYTPTPTASGVITFSYTVANNYGSVSAPGNVNITIVSAPLAVNDAASAAAGTIVPINLTANDVAGSSPISLTSLLVVSPLPASCGTLVNQNNGTVNLIAPSSVPLGACSFSYTVTDTSTPPLLSNVATVTVTITAPNLPPVAANDFATAIAGSTISINVIGNDTSATSTINPASVLVDLPSGGSAVANPNGTVSYTAPSAPGSYFFAYTVKDNLVPPQVSNAALVVVTVTGTDIPPVANNDAAGTVVNSALTLNVLANDTSATSTLDPTSIVVTTPTGGSAVANANGTVTYTAPATVGSYSFTYTVKDKFVPPATSNAATVQMTVAAANLAPVANNDAAATTPGATITLSVLANDTSSTSIINPASLIVTTPTGGAATANANGTVTYTAPTTPATSNVATVTISVVAVNIPPVANNDAAATVVGASIAINVIANDTSSTSTINPASLVLSGLTGGSAVANPNGTVTFTAPATAGVYSFNYTVNDNATIPATSNTATVTVTVTAPVAPVANNDTANTAFNTPVTITVLANDTAGSNPINSGSVAIASQALNGVATANLAGTIGYTPNATFSGTDSFTYTVRDSTGLISNAGTVTVTVAAAPAQTIAVSRAQFTLNGATWRVDGTVLPVPTPGTTLTLYNSPTVGGSVLINNILVQNNGSWTWSSPTSAPQPNAQLKMSVQSNQNPAVLLEQITVTVR